MVEAMVNDALLVCIILTGAVLISSFIGKYNPPPFFPLERKLSLSILKPLGLSGLTLLPDPG